MKHTYLSHYNEFICTADKCPDTCCAGWEVEIDEESLNKYKEYKGREKEDLVRSVDWNTSCFQQQDNGRCAFLQNDNFCRMYSKLGEDFLCKTCSTYPRHIEEFYNVREYSLSISCPEVAGQLLALKEPLEWSTIEDDVTEEPYMEFHQLLYDKLVIARSYMKQMMQNREVSFDLRCVQLLLMIDDMQSILDEGRWEECDENFEEWAGSKGLQRAKEVDALQQQDLQRLFALLYELEPLSEKWRDWLEEAEEILYASTPEVYDRNKQEFQRVMEALNMEIALEQLVVYFIFTYFCGAAYNEYVYAQAGEAVVNAYLIRELWMARWLRQDKQLTREEMADIAYHYSRELENSEDNLVMMEEMMDEIRIYR